MTPSQTATYKNPSVRSIVTYRKRSLVLAIFFLFWAGNLVYQMTRCFPITLRKTLALAAMTDDEVLRAYRGRLGEIAARINAVVPEGDNILDLTVQGPGVVGLHLLPRHVYFYPGAFSSQAPGQFDAAPRAPTNRSKISPEWLRVKNIRWILHDFNPCRNQYESARIERVAGSESSLQPSRP